MLLKFLVFAAVFSTCRCQFEGLCPNIMNDINTCAADTISTISELNSLFSNAPSVLSYQTSMSALGTVCNYTLQLQNFYRCFYTKYTQCIPAEWTKILPGIENVVDSIAYICDNANDLDLTCVNKNILEVSKCISEALKSSTPTFTTVDDHVSYFCTVHSITETCYGTVLSVCGGRTSEVLAEYTKYQIPPACNASDV